MVILDFIKVIVEKESFNEKENYYCIDRYTITDKGVMYYFKIYHNEEEKKEKRYIKAGYDPIYRIFPKEMVLRSLLDRDFYVVKVLQ